MILLVLVGVLWIVVLAPSAYRRISERQGVGSIDHFHRQLDLLEHAGPKLVTPAYRLHTAIPDGEAAPQRDAGGSEGPSMHRAKLVLLRPVDDGQSADIDDFKGTHYERVGVLDPPEPAVSRRETRGELQVYRRHQARRRCTTALRFLAVFTVSTLLLGLLPSLRLAWILTVFSGILLLGMVALVAYAREIETQRQRARSPRSAESADGNGSPDPYRGPAESGFPGAWDDEEDFPAQAVASN